MFFFNPYSNLGLRFFTHPVEFTLPFKDNLYDKMREFYAVI